MRIALMGITGRTGRCIAELALQRGHSVNALARDPSKVDLVHPSLSVFQGDARDEAAIEHMVPDADALVSALGPAKRSLVVASTSTENAIRALRKHHKKTLVVLSGAAMKLPGEKQKARHEVLLAVGRLLLGPLVRDKTREVELLTRVTDLDWVLVRPPRLTNGKGTGRYRANATALASMSIAREDLARFMLDQAESPTFARQAPFVSA